MKAVIFEKHGSLEELKWTDVPDPEPAPGEVLVRVRACSINHLDIWERQGLPGVTIQLPHISGSDIAGEIVKTGPDAGDLKPGTRVIVSPGSSCRKCEYCKKDYDSLCADYRMMGLHRHGGYAQFAVAPAQSVIPVSEKLSFEEWASIPLVFLTARHMLVTRDRLAQGETVLIHAAGSGVGSAAIQTAKRAGATVIITAGSRDKLEKAKGLGADHGILYQETDFVEEVRKITNGRGVDVVFEHIGPETWTQSLKSLAKGGRLVTCGATSGNEAKIDLRFLFARQLTILGSYMGGINELHEVLRLVEHGELKPVVDTVFPLKEARAGQDKMLKRQFFGKIVLVPE
ncbi:MAG: zinc-binding dehydrogenase [Candidatus Omnitrophica bacterium]|nr:zinc-binding dehydrogenase [Candidatus Omnitrophota bacterium]